MCGIAGLASLPKADFNLVKIANSMGKSISYRGPDDFGIFTSEKLSIAFAHERLSIFDLSEAGHQPMVSSSGRYVICLNGEIYNHIQLKKSIELNKSEIKWRGSSDTEIFLEAIEVFGLKETLHKSHGMFAFTLLDKRSNTFHLIRDRFGEKPLYWGLSGSGVNRSFVFASDLKAIKTYPYFNNQINDISFQNYLRLSYVPSPYSIFSDIYKLAPGHMISLKLPLDISNGLPESRNWWSMESIFSTSANKSFDHENIAISYLEDLLKKILIDQGKADVPLGVFLSGGIDSSLIAALLQNVSSRNVNSFTIGFEDSRFSEADTAREISKSIGTNHTEILLTSNDALEIIPYLSDLYAEPFADSSQIPTYLISKKARESGLTVALSGDGGDELFGGYNRHIFAPKLFNTIKYLPSYLIPTAAKVGKKINSELLNVFGDLISIKHLGSKFSRLINSLNYFNSEEQYYFSMISQCQDISSILSSKYNYLLNNSYQESVLYKITKPFSSFNFSSRMMIYDTLTYLPDDILVKVDRAAMGVGLETRAPFLDHRVAEFSWKLPLSMKIRGMKGKWILREILKKYIPVKLTEKPKSGFAIPLSSFLSGPLRPWAQELLNPSRIIKEGKFNHDVVDKLFLDHIEARADNSSILWNILMWQAWQEKYIET